MDRAALNATYSAFVVFFDIDGAMEVWPMPTLAEAEERANAKQSALDQRGLDDCGHYQAVAKLPRKRIYKVHAL